MLLFPKPRPPPSDLFGSDAVSVSTFLFVANSHKIDSPPRKIQFDQTNNLFLLCLTVRPLELDGGRGVHAPQLGLQVHN